jgi:hypothetical protein
MTPKEKAEELINKFHKFTYTAVHANKTSGEYADAIKCSLIAVDEILKLVYTIKMEQYWEQVKKEIEKL